MSGKQHPKGRLAREIQQTKPFPSTATEAYLNLVRTAAGLAAQVKQLCRAEGISEPQYNVLRILRGAGPGGLLCGQVAARMVTRVPDVSRLLDRIHEAGLILKQPEPHDRRAIRVKLAAKGSRILGRLDGPLEGLHADQFSALDTREQRSLIELLEKANPTPDRNLQ